MKIKSDNTPKTSIFKDWLKKHQTSEITRTVFFASFALFSVIGLFVVLEGVITKKDIIEMENTTKDVNNIIKYHPVIKCIQLYYLPDEYELEVKGGRNRIVVNHIGRGLSASYYLTDCNLVLSKTKDTVTENFKEALFKKRGYVSDKVAEERRIKADVVMKEIEANAIKLEEESQKDLVQQQSEENATNIVVYDNDTIRTKVVSTMQTGDYYQRLEYASLYPALVRATTDLIAYKLTDEYNELKKVRFATNDKYRELNIAYNSVHGTMWRLHQKFGTKYGSYTKLETGKLKVEMISGKLEFSMNGVT